MNYEGAARFSRHPQPSKNGLVRVELSEIPLINDNYPAGASRLFRKRGV